MAFKPTIEIPLFLATIGFMLTMSVNNNLLLDRTCYTLLHFNKSDCALLGIVNNNITQKLEAEVEPYSDYISLVKTIVDSVLSSVLCLFIAPWSDRFGRKPILVIGLLGGTISMGLHIMFAAIDTLTPWFILALSLPVLLTGGSATFMTVLSAYLTDSTTKEERGFRMGVFDIVMTCAVLLGNTASSYILVATNYVMVYAISGVLHILALVFTVFFIPESLREREYETLLFIVVLDWVFEIFDTQNRGMNWRLNASLEDLDSVDDIVLLAQIHQHMQSKLNQLQEEPLKAELKMSGAKTYAQNRSLYHQ